MLQVRKKIQLTDNQYFKKTQLTSIFNYIYLIKIKKWNI